MILGLYFLLSMHERIRPRTDVFFSALVSTLSLHSYDTVWQEHFEKSCEIPVHEANAKINVLLLIPSKVLFTNYVDNFWTFLTTYPPLFTVSNVWSIKIQTTNNLSLWLCGDFSIILFNEHLILKVLTWEIIKVGIFGLPTHCWYLVQGVPHLHENH